MSTLADSSSSTLIGSALSCHGRDEHGGTPGSAWQAAMIADPRRERIRRLGGQ
jgi:hypothetical protein